jgi:hypothetical protein
MKRIVLHWGFVLVGLFICSMGLMLELVAYKQKPAAPVVCDFVQWETPKKDDSRLRMKLKCEDKEYYSNDATLILWHLNNPEKKIKGMADLDGNVTGKKE